MPQLEIGKFRDVGTGSTPVLDEVEAKLFDRVRQGASEAFQIHLNGPGSKVNDQWKKGEQDLVGFPHAGILEKDGEFQIQFAIAGFDHNDIQVVATPEFIMLHAVATQKHEQDLADCYSCEFGQRQLFRRFLMPQQIDVDGVTAHFDKDILQIRAPIKVTSPKAFAAVASAAGPLANAVAPQPQPAPGMNQVMAIIGPYAPGPVTESTTLDDLGLSSMERLMLTLELELQLGILISDTESQALRSVGEIAQILRSMA